MLVQPCGHRITYLLIVRIPGSSAVRNSRDVHINPTESPGKQGFVNGNLEMTGGGMLGCPLGEF